jgi:toxin-antitoxin system PIN domain toxin
MTYLADVNVWLAFILGHHVHHAATFRWFVESSQDEIAFCRVTQMGVLRLLTNQHVMIENPLKPVDAWRTFDALMSMEKVLFVHEPRGLEAEWRKSAEYHSAGPNWGTDAYLAAFATAAGMTVATFDKAFAKRRGVPARFIG